jgi:hypothetical protein
LFSKLCAAPYLPDTDMNATLTRAKCLVQKSHVKMALMTILVASGGEGVPVERNGHIYGPLCYEVFKGI